MGPADEFDKLPAARPLVIGETVAGVYDQILAEILRGERPAGSVVRDIDVAASLGVSRTPVREAMLLLRTAGVLEVSASRYTRVAVIDDVATLQLAEVWHNLFTLVVDELIASDTEVDLDRLEAEHAASEVADGDRYAFVLASGRFFDYVVSRSRNPHLVRSIQAVAHAIRLAVVSRPFGDELQAVLGAQIQLVEAIRARDLVLGRASMRTLQAIRTTAS